MSGMKKSFKDLVKRLFKYYFFEIILVLVFLYPSIALAIVSQERLVNYFEKIALAGLGLTMYYIVRYIKIGVIDWDKDERMKMLYAIALLLYFGLVFGRL
ncbi:MAG: hypothetical protein QXX12_07145 [Nanopusillaceae archaeon]